MIAGGKDISNLPLEWRHLVDDVIGMRLRAEFGVTVLDKDLTDREKTAVEAFQNAFNKRKANRSS